MNNIKTVFDMLQQLFHIMNRKQKKRCVGAFLAMLVAAIFETLGIGVIIPFILSLTQPDVFMDSSIIKRFVGLLHISNDFHIIVAMSIGVIVIYLLKSIIVLHSNHTQIKFRGELERDLSVLMLKSYLKRPYTYYLEINSAEVLRGVQGDIAGVAQIVDGFFLFFTEGLTFLLIGIFLITMNPIIALMLTGVVLLCAVSIIYVFKGKTKQWGRRARVAFAARFQYASQAVNGIKEIIVLQRRESFTKLYEKAARAACECDTGYLFIGRIPAKIIELVFIIVVVLMAVISVGSKKNIILMVPQLGAIVIACVRLLPSVSTMTSSINNLVYYRETLQSAHGNINEARKYEEQLKDYTVSKGQSEEILNPEQLFRGALNIKTISWCYSKAKANVLNALSLEIKKGDAIALIGESGAGKTTLADVVLGLLKPQKGVVEVDGVDIFAIPEAWAKVVGYVPQTVFLIDDTIRNNIIFGANPVAEEDQIIWKALEQAQLKSFVEQLPEGLDTLVGERGIRFSGGQRQRIAIARALYNNPAILVLDEATSALDNETETAVMESIDALKGHKTLIIIAHRLSTIRNCNKIYEIKDGKAELVRS